MLCNPKSVKGYIKRRMPEANFIQKFGIYLDFYWCLMRYGAITNDYFEYEFWKKKGCVRKTYITMLWNKKIKKYLIMSQQVFLEISYYLIVNSQNSEI